MFDKRISPVLLFGCPIWGVPTYRFSIKVCVNSIPDNDVRTWIVELLQTFSERVTSNDIKSYRVYRAKNEIFIDFNSLSMKSSVLNGFYRKPVPIDIIECRQNDPEFEKVHSNFCKFALGCLQIFEHYIGIRGIGSIPY